ncbi:diguanylate cyclase [Photobacterium sagamiensis]|uniref:sensor domain-containing diguanylate cyclase n=1 Tax=Photobacterium sagamiensis TaxID=2910241 RepID=UPI003D14DC96
MKKHFCKVRVQNRQERRTYLTLTLYFIFFGIIVAILTSLINYQMQVINIDSALNNRFIKTKESKYQYISQSVISQNNTLGSILTNPTTQRYLNTPNTESLSLLENLLLVLISTNSEFMQVRFIEASGQEVIRIERDTTDTISVVKKADLQNKSSRYYFKETRKLSAFEYWHSKLDLNMEHGQIEYPIRPTIRASVPVIHNAMFAGIFIINVSADDILSNAIESPDFTMMLIDKEGEILAHPNSELAWSRYLPGRRSMFELYPDITPEFLQSPQSKVDNQYQIPLKDVFKNGEQLRLILIPKPEMIDRISQSNLLSAALIAVIVLFISFPLSWLAALLPARLQQKLTDTLSELSRTNELLDKHVITSKTDAQGVITQVSQKMCDISGYTKDELIGQTHRIVTHPNTNPHTHESLWKTIKSGQTWVGELQNISQSGEAYWLQSIISPEYKNDGSLIGYAQVAQNITSKKALEKISVTDALTQVYNRHRLDQILGAEDEIFIRYQHHYAVILLDLDHFKHINDTYGHQAGDSVLVQVAEVLKENIRKVDYVGRWGGEEFLVICPK